MYKEPASPWSSLVKGGEQLDGANSETYVLHNFLVFQKHNYLPLGPTQPSFPSTKELLGSSQEAIV